jgi:hypothetical protein
MSEVAFLSPRKDSQCFLLSLTVQSLVAFLATPLEMPQAGSGPMNGRSAPSLAKRSAISFPSVPS